MSTAIPLPPLCDCLACNETAFTFTTFYTTYSPHPLDRSPY
jgi:hypothetical protein